MSEILPPPEITFVDKRAKCFYYCPHLVERTVVQVPFVRFDSYYEQAHIYYEPMEFEYWSVTLPTGTGIIHA